MFDPGDPSLPQVAIVRLALTRIRDKQITFKGIAT